MHCLMELAPKNMCCGSWICATGFVPKYLPARTRIIFVLDQYFERSCARAVTETLVYFFRNGLGKGLPGTLSLVYGGMPSMI